jgi:uncharacterized cupin superfamily protein
MSADARPVAVDAATVSLRQPLMAFPEPLAALLARRQRRALGDVFGLSAFGVNLTRLPPGAISALRHTHTRQDEFVYILEGAPVLITDAGETPLRPGWCAGFKGGSGDAHHLVNRSQAEALYLEIGDRGPDDAVTYPDDDIKLDRTADGGWRVARKDGSAY